MQVASLAEARRLRVDNDGADEEDAEVDDVGEDDFEADVFDDFEVDAFGEDEFKEDVGCACVIVGCILTDSQILSTTLSAYINYRQPNSRLCLPKALHNISIAINQN